jgi:ABC-2 type transport system ATP-binding protein
LEKSIQVRGVTKEYPGVTAVKQMTFSVEKGAVHGFLGPNGAGKSTTMKIICGLMAPTKGQVFINGYDLTQNLKILKRKIGFLPENPPLYTGMKVEEYITFVGGIRGLRGKILDQSVGQILEKCGLENVKGRRIGNLSLGYKQRVGVAQSLVHNPEIVILDEPTKGLDPKAVDEMRKLILNLKDDRTILFSSHLLHEVQNLCSHITIIKEGEVLQNGPIQNIRKVFQDKKVFKVLLKRFDSNLHSRFQEKFKTFKCDLKSSSDEIDLKIVAPSEGDKREEITSFFVEQNCGLLSFKEERIGLEEIFRMATKGTNP